MLELRDASGGDEPWLRALFAACQPVGAALAVLPDDLGDRLLKMQYDARQEQYRLLWPQAVQRVIHVQALGQPGVEPDGAAPDALAHRRAVGALWADDSAQGMQVLDIAVLPAWRGKGIATRCLQDLLATAARRQLPVRLQVALDNPARRLYERLGFVATGVDDGVNLPMLCRPRTPFPTEMCNEQA